jgi:anti-anti-sigma factor
VTVSNQLDRTSSEREACVTNTEGAAPGRLMITSTTVGEDVSVVALDGEIDHNSSSELRDTLVSLLRRTPRTVVDFSGVTFMDSSGINALIAAHQAADAAPGGSLRLAAPQAAVQRLLNLVGVDALIPCYDTLELALAV